jgi:hypothetical protein
MTHPYPGALRQVLARRCKRRVGAPEMRRPGSRVKRGHSFGLHKHDRCSCFDLRRNCCFVCRYNGTDRAGLDPKALLARKPEHPVLHRCQCGAARECWNCNRSRVANRNDAWLFQIVGRLLWQVPYATGTASARRGSARGNCLRTIEDQRQACTHGRSATQGRKDFDPTKKKDGR